MKRPAEEKTKKNKATKAGSIKQEQPLLPIQPEEEKPFDFGGLPSRDLKKNLGCG